MNKRRVIKLFLCTIICACSAIPLYAKPAFEVLTPAIPVVPTADINPVIGLKIEGPCKSLKLTLDLSGTTDLTDIEALELYVHSREVPDYNVMKRIGTIPDLNQAAITLPPLLAGTHYIWASINVADDTDIAHTFSIRFSEITLDEVASNVERDAVIQRVGIPVRDTGDDGGKGYRIPGISTTPTGTLLAIYDARFDSARDLQGHMDIGLSRSTDGGQTWEPMKQIIDMKTYGGLPEKFNGVSDACILVDDNTGHIFVAGCWMHGVNDNEGNWISGLTAKDKHWKHQWVGTGSMPGLDPKGTCQFLMVKSEDDGKTWSEPQNLTKDLKDPAWHLFAPAPGRGITMKDGTLVMPTQGRDEKGRPFSNLIYSKDHGKTWVVSNAAKTDTTESQVVELSDCSLMLNMRDNRNRAATDHPAAGRSVSITRDLGQTWTEHVTSRKALPEPVCCAGLHKHRYKGKDLLVFSNPPQRRDQGGRVRMTLKLSHDEGMTWPAKHHLLLDTYKGAYSCLTSVDEDHIGILYEGSRGRIFFQKVALSDFDLAPTPHPLGYDDALSRGYRIPLVDLDADTERQTIIDREKGQYLGHPNTVMLDDQKTIYIAYPKGHGRGALVLKKSTDAGRTWSERLPTPENWTSSKEVPTLHQVVDAKGTKRLIMFSGLYPCRMAVSEDEGSTWSPLEPIGDWGGIVCMGDVIPLKTPGHYLAFFHDDGRFFKAGGKRSGKFTLYTTLSTDGGLTWQQPVALFTRGDVHLCEPGAIRSPDGNTIAVLLRENARKRNSFVIFSDDEGASWTSPRELPGALTGDRHQLMYTPDGRILASFRDRTHESPTAGDWVGWVGTWGDIVNGNEGQYRIRFKDNHKGNDCAYPTLEQLPDGSFLNITYGHWDKGEAPYILQVHFSIEELDRLAK